MVAAVNVDVFLGADIRASFYHIKASAKVDWIKQALWACFGWKEGSYRFKLVTSEQPVDSSVTLGSIAPIANDANEAPCVRMNIVPGETFIR